MVPRTATVFLVMFRHKSKLEKKKIGNSYNTTKERGNIGNALSESKDLTLSFVSYRLWPEFSIKTWFWMLQVEYYDNLYNFILDLTKNWCKKWN